MQKAKSQNQKGDTHTRCAVSSRFLYPQCYILGAQVRRVRYRVRRYLRQVGRFVGHGIYRVLDFLLLRYLRGIVREIVRFFKGFPLAGTRVKQSFSRGFGFGIATLFLLPFYGLRRHKAAIGTVCNVVLPLLAAVGFIYTVRYWSSCRYVIEVEYQGDSIGYIDRTDVFTLGAQLAADRVVSMEGSNEETDTEGDMPPSTVPSDPSDAFEVNYLPVLHLTANNMATLMDANTVCDRILKTAGDKISMLSGVYIDGHFEGAIESREKLEQMLSDILKTYSDGVVDERAEFVEKVEIVDGLYPSSAALSVTDLKKRLTVREGVDTYYEAVKGDSLTSIARKFDMTLSELLARNPSYGEKDRVYVGDTLLIKRAQPYLQVQVVQTIYYEEEIEFQVQTVKDPSQYVIYEAVRTSGKNGKQTVTAEVTYIDGVEQSRKVVNIAVTKPAVDRVIVVGSKEINPDAIPGVATGKFIWPTPGHTYITSNYGDREGVRDYRAHQGIDIASSRIDGAAIIASDGGVVVEATYHWSYGNYVRIDHGGGITTMYAHCQELLVEEGDKVKQGQVIAKVGSTGYSTGPHLHFQVEKRGSPVNPWRYVSR